MDPWRYQLLLLKKKVLLLKKRDEERRERQFWVRPIWEERRLHSEYFTAMRLMRDGDPEYFHKYYRMSPKAFDELHSLVGACLEKEHLCREPISSEERLAMTLRYLSSGMAIADVALAFLVGLETCREAVHLTCQVLWCKLMPLYLQPPSEAAWLKIAKGFQERWNFPNCVGAVDGKHVMIVAPNNSGSLYYNYKKTFSIVLMAVVDHDYQFVLVDVGAPGRHSDGGVLKSSPIGTHLEDGTLGLPGPARLPRSSIVTPHVFVGDEAFQLRPDFMRPYPGVGLPPEMRVFNYRLSRARRIVENAFGIMSARYRILLRPINLSPINAENVVKATCVLHNFLRSKSDSVYCSPNFMDLEGASGNIAQGLWRAEAVATSSFALQPTSARNFARTASDVRNTFANYFVKDGVVPWQWAHAGVAPPSSA